MVVPVFQQQSTDRHSTSAVVVAVQLMAHGSAQATGIALLSTSLEPGAWAAVPQALK
jgi:hypothetical protein